MSVRENLVQLQAEIARVARVCGRDPAEITLMPVTKTQPPEAIREAIACGYGLIGENRVQEIRAKEAALADMPHQVHLIGQLQTNKVKEVIGRVSCVQSLDREKLALKLQERLEFVDQHLDVLIQVNTSGEVSKSGVSPEAVMALIENVLSLDRLRIRGLMTIGTLTDEEAEIRRCFRQLVGIQREAQARFADKANFDVLSMGMSGDWPLAVAEGATLIRVGGAIFGSRNVQPM